MPTALLILNPASGKHDADETEAIVVERLRDHDYDVEVKRTEGEGDARQFAREAADAGTDLVVIAGGDGSVREVASGVTAADGDARVGILPLGTANLLARALDIPVDDLAAAADVAAGDGSRRIDVIELVGRDDHAVLMVDAGFDARLVRHASRGVKDVLGAMAYVVAGIRSMFGLKRVELDLEIDGEPRRARGHSVLCINVGRVGPIVIDEDTEPDDGVLHVGIVDNPRPWSVARTAVGMVLAGRDAHPNVSWISCTHLVLRAEPGLELQVDGDPAGETPIELRLLPAALAVAVPTFTD